MDRNHLQNNADEMARVATREGGVDRNLSAGFWPLSRQDVATREGGVDRNCSFAISAKRIHKSPPARVAWIEIEYWIFSLYGRFVATREGGVDRNILQEGMSYDDI